MNQEKRLLMMYCEENIHAGAGSSTGTIDLPIQREGHTEFPKFESSTLRGAIRENIEDTLEKAQLGEFNRIFGNKDNGEIASLIDFPDAKILLFPVRSFKGIFAWITCPFVLKRFKKDINNWFNNGLEFDIPTLDNSEIIINNSPIVYEGKVVLEEFLFECKQLADMTKIEEKYLGKWITDLFTNPHDIIKDIEHKTAIVSDDVFRDFVNLYTVRITRNKITTETGTAQEGALFNEEFLPSESVLYSFALTSDEFKKETDKESYMKSKISMKYFEEKFPTLFRLGGDKGIGKGLIRQSLINF
ncbi:MAG: type III-B CRISPR module RAMP protein Cmr4 [Deltaproteobacteria bacterium]